MLSLAIWLGLVCLMEAQNFCPTGFIAYNGLCLQQANSCPANFILIQGICQPALLSPCNAGFIGFAGQCCTVNCIASCQLQTTCSCCANSALIWPQHIFGGCQNAAPACNTSMQQMPVVNWNFPTYTTTSSCVTSATNNSISSNCLPQPAWPMGMFPQVPPNCQSNFPISGNASIQPCQPVAPPTPTVSTPCTSNNATITSPCTPTGPPIPPLENPFSPCANDSLKPLEPGLLPCTNTSWQPVTPIPNPFLSTTLLPYTTTAAAVSQLPQSTTSVTDIETISSSTAAIVNATSMETTTVSTAKEIEFTTPSYIVTGRTTTIGTESITPHIVIDSTTTAYSINSTTSSISSTTDNIVMSSSTATHLSTSSPTTISSLSTSSAVAITSTTMPSINTENSTAYTYDTTTTEAVLSQTLSEPTTMLLETTTPFSITSLATDYTVQETTAYNELSASTSTTTSASTADTTTAAYPKPEEIQILCPPGTVLINGLCRLVYCASGIYSNNECLQISCPKGYIWIGIKCAKPQTVLHDIPFNTSNIVEQQTPEIKINNVNHMQVNISGIDAGTPDYAEEDLENEYEDDTENSAELNEFNGIAEPKCCTVITPRTCVRSKTHENKWSCYSRRYNRCGEFCIAPVIYLKTAGDVRETEEGALLVPTDTPLAHCRTIGKCAESAKPHDCSGCLQNIASSCSSYCYYQRCSSRYCQLYDQREFCSYYAAEVAEGCRLQDGCLDDWCSTA